jgi:hypothetical protein
MVGGEKQVDLRTYMEVDVVVLDVRFRDEVEAELEDGWMVSLKFEKLALLASTLASAQGPLLASDAKRIPVFPGRMDVDQVAAWFVRVFKLVPSSGAFGGPAPPPCVLLGLTNPHRRGRRAAGGRRGGGAGEPAPGAHAGLGLAQRQGPRVGGRVLLQQDLRGDHVG